MRFAFPLFPEAALYFAPTLATLSVIAIVYGALVAMVQPDMKKLVAYSSVSHMGFVVLGTAAMNVQGVQGSVYQMLAHGVSTGGLFCLVGMLSDRRHTRLISEYGGIKKVVPRLTAASLAHHAGLGRAARHERLHRRVPDHARRVQVGSALRRRRRPGRDPVRGLHAVDVPARLLRRDHQRAQPRDARPVVREWAIVGPLAAAAIFMGVFPNVFLKPMEPARDAHRAADGAAAADDGFGAGRRRTLRTCTPSTLGTSTSGT